MKVTLRSFGAKSKYLVFVPEKRAEEDLIDMVFGSDVGSYPVPVQGEVRTDDSYNLYLMLKKGKRAKPLQRAKSSGSGKTSPPARRIRRELASDR